MRLFVLKHEVHKWDNTNARGPAKTSLKRLGVVANPCWSQEYNPTRINFFFFLFFYFLFFLSQLLPIIFKISRNTRTQDAKRLTLFRSKSLFSCNGIAIHITEIIPCLLSQPSSSVCPFETWTRGRGWCSVKKETAVSVYRGDQLLSFSLWLIYLYPGIITQLSP